VHGGGDWPPRLLGFTPSRMARVASVSSVLLLMKANARSALAPAFANRREVHHLPHHGALQSTVIFGPRFAKLWLVDSS